ITKLYETEMLLTLKPSELDELVTDELRILLKRELMDDARQKEKIKREIQQKCGSRGKKQCKDEHSNFKQNESKSKHIQHQWIHVLLPSVI
ncbi:MAG: hypothetical protein KGD66_10585, partial [Candidatus Lokiarchaeota archaeon]|nr:hypothetical protein [Candidatus Lokiarchaeota archaeon]